MVTPFEPAALPLVQTALAATSAALLVSPDHADQTPLGNEMTIFVVGFGCGIAATIWAQRLLATIKSRRERIINDRREH